MDPDPQVPAESGNLGKASPLPVLVECLDDREAPLGRQVAGAVDPPIVEKFPERERKDLPGQRSPAHLGGDLARQQLRRRSGEMDLAAFGAQQAVDERLPARSRLDLVEKAMHRLDVLLLRIEGEVRIGDQAEVAVPQVVQPVIEEVEVEDVLARDALLQQTRDHLVEVGRLAAAAYADTDGGLAWHGLDAQAPWHAGRQFHLLVVQDQGLEGLQQTP